MRVVWTRPALRDLEAIGNFIARDNPIAAAKIVTRIFDQTGTIALKCSRCSMARASGRITSIEINDTRLVRGGPSAAVKFLSNGVQTAPYATSTKL